MNERMEAAREEGRTGYLFQKNKRIVVFLHTFAIGDTLLDMHDVFGNVNRSQDNWVYYNQPTKPFY